MSWSIADISDPQLIHRSRLPTRAYHIPESSLCLNGEWDFSFADESVNAAIPGTQASSAAIWRLIEVPGHWQLQGYGEPHYTNTANPFPFDPPNVPSKNPTGTYKKSFYVPEQWANDSRLRLRFEGVDSAYHVFLNGKFVGYSQGSRNPAEFDISDIVELETDNELVVVVYQWSIGTYLEDQDMWWLSGIFRDVYLLGFPKAGHIEDFTIKTLLDDKYENAELKVNVEVPVGKGDLSLELKNAAGDIIHTVTKTVASSLVDFSIDVVSPHKWTAEDPYLYNLTMSLSENGAETYTVSHEVGFRRVEMLNKQICVNGVPIMFRGIDKHEHHKEFGRAVPFESLKKDLYNMKKLNINAIRTSHYPDDPRMYSLCNELGFWLIDEADLETQAVIDAVKIPIDSRENAKNPSFDIANAIFTENPLYEKAYLDRGRQMIKRDINHPSIIIWSLGNESLYGRHHRTMKKMFNEMDGTRPIHYEGDVEAETSDMFSSMYMSYERLENFAKAGHDKPMILCEYAYCLGNGPGGLVKYQEVFRKYRKQLQGGFVWEWSNHGVMHTFPDGTRDIAYGADFPLEDPVDGLYAYDGIVSSTHEPDTPSVIELKKAFAPVLMTETSAGKYVIENLFDFSTLKDINLTYKIVAFDDFKETLLGSGEVELKKLGPLEETTIEAPKFLAHPGEVWITWSFKQAVATVYADAGHEITWYQFKLADSKKKEVAPVKLPAATVTDYMLNFQLVESRGVQFIFDKAAGSIFKWKVNGNQKIIPGSNCLTFWRDMNNDFDKYGPYWKRFRVHEMTHSVRDVKVVEVAGALACFTVHSFYAPPVLAWGIDVYTTYTLYGKKLVINHKLKPRGFQKDFIPETLPRVGMELTLPERLKSVEWFGRGPLDSYADRKDGQAIGIYKNEIENMDVYNDYPQENGNRADTRWIKVQTPHDNEGFTARMNNEFNFKISNKDYKGAKHPFEIKKGLTVLRLDQAQQGFGSIFGPGVEKEFQVANVEREFTIVLDVIG